MKNIYLLFVFAILTPALAVSPEGNFEKTQLQIGDQKYTYYVVKSGQEASFNLAGGAVNTILVRLVEGTEAILWLGDEEHPKNVKWNQDSTSATTKWNNKAVSKAYKYVLKTQAKSPAKFKVKVIGGTALVRVLQKSTVPYVTMAPRSSAGEITTVVKELKTIYWHTNKDTPAVYVIDGKGKAEIFTRLIYTPDLMGTQRYSIWIEVNGNKSLYEFETNRSEVAYLEAFPNLGIGVAQKIKIPLSNGKNTIKISPRGSEKVIVRLAVPKTMVSNKKTRKK